MIAWNKLLLWISLCGIAVQGQAQAPAAFVQVKDKQFILQGNPYTYIGANIWYVAYLAAEGASGEERLRSELDQMHAIGLDNLRIMVCGEGPEQEPNRVVPALQPTPGVYREDILKGLDFALAEMGKRNMRAILCLNNFFHWSGGMAQYVSWATGEPIPYPETTSWDDFQRFSARFYSTPKAKQLSRKLMRTLLTRVNTYTGIPYSEDPAIMAWQLGNEPREFGNDQAYLRWVKHNSRLINRKDPNHLISVGNEGEIDKMVGTTYRKTAAFKHIDYLTVHLWPQNWGWFDPLSPETTFDSTFLKTKQYLQKNAAIASAIGKPIVLEEFGLARDQGLFHTDASTQNRDRFFTFIFENTIKNGEFPYQGINFWAWSGAGYSENPGQAWKVGHPLAGDPPHEPQGWYGVYASDRSTLEMLRNFSKAVKSEAP